MFLKGKPPYVKIIFFVGVIGSFLVGLVLLLVSLSPKCNKYQIDILFGRELNSINNLQLPGEIRSFLSETTNSKICNSCCFFPNKYVNIVYFYQKNLKVKMDSVIQAIRIYDEELANKSKKYDIPDFSLNLENLKLDQRLCTVNNTSYDSFLKKLASYSDKNNITNIIFYSDHPSDSSFKIEINNKSFPIITNEDVLIEMKYSFLRDNKIKSGKRDNISTKFLLVYNPILERKFISIKNTNYDSSQTIRDGDAFSTVSFICDPPGPDSIIWTVKTQSNVNVPIQKGNRSFTSQRLNLMNPAVNGSLSIKVIPYKKGYLSNEFPYSIIVHPKPIPLPKPKNLAFDQINAIITCDEVLGAKGYNFKITASNNAIGNFKRTISSLTLSQSDVRKIIESNINCNFNVEVYAYNSQTTSGILSNNFKFSALDNLNPPVIEHARDIPFNSIKWKRASIFESYWIIISRKSIDPTSDPNSFLINQECLANEFLIKPDILKPKDSDSKIQFYVVVKTILFNKESQWTKELAFQIKDCNVYCTILYCY